MKLPDACPAISGVVLPHERLCWWPAAEKKPVEDTWWFSSHQCFTEVPISNSLGLCPEHLQEAKERNPL